MGTVPWPRYSVQAGPKGGPEVRYSSAIPSRIEGEAQRLRDMGLEEGKHFTVNSSRRGEKYIYIRMGGLIRAARLSVHGSGEQQKLAAEFVERILQRTWETGGEVYEKTKKVIEEGKAWGSLTLKGFVKEVWKGKRKLVVKTFGCTVAVGGSGLLHIAVAAEVGGVEDVYVFSFGRFGKMILGFARARVNAPGGREADAERFAALVKALTGKKPKVLRSSRGKITIMLSKTHLYRLARYVELAEAVETWLAEAFSKR
ncbi:MAG: PaRep2b protein [Pyrobaculum sp.]